MDDTELPVDAYDPLMLEHPETNPMEVTIDLYKKGSEFRVYWIEDEEQYTINPLSSKKKKESVISEWTMTGQFRLISVYHPDWSELTKPHYTKIFKMDEAEFVNINNQIRSQDNTIYLQRQGKIVCSLPLRLSAPSGDKAAYPFTDESRHLVVFNETMDGVMGVQTNKSHIREEDIEPCVAKAIRECVKTFAKKQYKMFQTTLAARSAAQVATRSATQAITRSATQVATRSDAQAQAATRSDAQATQSASPVYTPPTVRVQEHTRYTGVNDQMVVGKIRELRELLTTFNPTQLTISANADANAAYKAADQLIQWIQLHNR